MPSGRVWNVPLGNNELWWKQFDINAPEAQVYIDMKQREYALIRAQARAGEFVGPDGPDPEGHRRVLDFVGKQMGLSNPEDIFIPTGLPKETRLPHRTAYSENFNTADSSTLGPQLTWVKVAGSAAQVVGNRCQAVVASGFDECRVRASHDVSTSDVFTQGTVTDLGDFGGVMMAARFQPAADSMYTFGIAQFGASSYEWGIAKWQAGTETYPLGSVDTTAANDNDVVRFEISGSTLTGKVNSVQFLQTTDTTFATGTRGGFRVLKDGGSGGFDDWSFSDLNTTTGGGHGLLLGVG
jgi:hypothetical protein